MKAYFDSNIYISFLLGEESEEVIGNIFVKGVECAFVIVSSPTVFAEIGKRCGGRGSLLLQMKLDELMGAGKIEIVRDSIEMDSEAAELNERTPGRLGLNDFVHALLAAKHADVFVTNDTELRKVASGKIRAVSLSDFEKEVLQPHLP
jgi:predicted nucleic acid-binding protein